MPLAWLAALSPAREPRSVMAAPLETKAWGLLPALLGAVPTPWPVLLMLLAVVKPRGVMVPPLERKLPPLLLQTTWPRSLMAVALTGYALLAERFPRSIIP